MNIVIMSALQAGFCLIGGFSLLMGGILILQYNGTIKLRNRYRNAFSQIEVQLKRRYDLIPNLIETAKSFMKHERDTLESVIEARNVASQACSSVKQDQKGGAMSDLVRAESGLGKALGSFWSLTESYPDLKSNANMLQVSEELSSTENRIAFARQSYNDAVTRYNTKIQSFPINVLSEPFRFTSAPLFETDPEERKPVKVSFD